MNPLFLGKDQKIYHDLADKFPENSTESEKATNNESKSGKSRSSFFHLAASVQGHRGLHLNSVWRVAILLRGERQLFWRLFRLKPVPSFLFSATDVANLNYQFQAGSNAIRRKYWLRKWKYLLPAGVHLKNVYAKKSISELGQIPNKYSSAKASKS